MSENLEEKKTLLSMSRVFRTDIQDIQQRGAGYYSCEPFVKRYNKLLATAKELYSDDQGILLKSFDDVEDTKSVDPADKMKVTQRVLIELGQLIAFMESVIGKYADARKGAEISSTTEQASDTQTTNTPNTE
jgi:hypothetical protein